ncbi:disease resistance protein Roq1-like [Humulus lupulus]|uniref:disease resistance protein Roq1-like n=1 Tax=Humulus lupulus TaxID=3486 RepID=UPI002B40B5D2|nr:disease resistance protein Roq1-like [Humulus lupulus]
MASLDSYMKIEPSILCYLWTDGAYSCLLDLKGCHNLTTLSQMSGNIKFICLRSTAIQELDSSICSLNNLLVLDLYNCKLLRNLPNNLSDLESLEYLDLYGCILIDKFPELPKSIKGLDLSKTSIQQVNPSSFECLPFLNILYMNQCRKLESLPITICKLESLTKLFLENCFRLESFPEILEPMEKLKELYLMGTRIEELPSSIEKLSMLEKLCLDYCKSLKFIPTTICKLKSLIILSFIECWQLKCLPEILEPMENLKELIFEKAWIEEIPSSIEKLILLEKLYLINCKHLKLITTNICKLKSLKLISLYNCSRLKYFPEILEPMENLEQLYLSGTWIEALPSSIERLVMLKILDLASCENLKSIPTNIYNMPKISEINISKYPKVKTLSYYGLPSLTVLGPSDTTAGLSYYYNSQTLQQSKCRSSCSITTTNLKVFFRLHSDDGLKYGIHFTCCECFLFYTVHNVLASQYFEDNIFQKYYNDFHFKDLNRPRAIFSYSGNAIPLWFTNQSVGSSIEVNLVPSSDNYFSFLGFALCIVVDFDPSTSNPGVEDLSCEYIFKMSDGQSSKLCSTLPRQKATFDSDGDSNVDNNDILDWSSGNVFIWYLYQKDNWNYLSGVDKASFEFYFGESNDSIGKERIKQCGIRLVYRQDAKEFDTADAHSY